MLGINGLTSGRTNGRGKIYSSVGTKMYLRYFLKAGKVNISSSEQGAQSAMQQSTGKDLVILQAD